MSSCTVTVEQSCLKFPNNMAEHTVDIFETLQQMHILKLQIP